MWSIVGDSFKILHIVNNNVVNSEALNLFFSDFKKSLSGRDKLSDNYSEANFNIKSHLMFDALYTKSGDFVACTGIFKRPQWPTGMYRLLNRTFFSREFRKSHQFSYFASDYLLPSQIKNCKAELDFTFVSRQGINGGNFLKKLQQRPFFKNHYRVSEFFVQVAPSIDEKSFQKILYYKKNPNFSIQLPGVAELKQIPNGIKEVQF